jgi:hypothetical protein
VLGHVRDDARSVRRVAALKTFCTLLERGVIPQLANPEEAPYTDKGYSPPHENEDPDTTIKALERATMLRKIH